MIMIIIISISISIIIIMIISIIITIIIIIIVIIGKRILNNDNNQRLIRTQRDRDTERQGHRETER